MNDEVEVQKSKFLTVDELNIVLFILGYATSDPRLNALLKDKELPVRIANKLSIAKLAAEKQRS